MQCTDLSHRRHEGATHWSKKTWSGAVCTQLALFFTMSLAGAPTATHAQVDEGAVLSIKQLPESERLQLRRTLAEPTPSNATFATLLRHFDEKQRAAELLGDYVSKEAILREAIRLLPKTPRYLNNLGILLPLQTHADESLALLEQASESATVATDRAFYTMNLARTLANLET